MTSFFELKVRFSRKRQDESAPNFFFRIYSGVARVPCAPRQKIFLHPHQQKLQNLKWNIGQKRGRNKICIFLC